MTLDEHMLANLLYQLAGASSKTVGEQIALKIKAQTKKMLLKSEKDRGLE